MSEYDAHKQLMLDCEESHKKKGFNAKFKFLVDKEEKKDDTKQHKLGDPNNPSTWQILD